MTLKCLLNGHSQGMLKIGAKNIEFGGPGQSAPLWWAFFSTIFLLLSYLSTNKYTSLKSA